MDTLQVTLKYTKSTKGTHVYSDDSEGAPLPSVYFKRSALPATPPAFLRVTVAAAE